MKTIKEHIKSNTFLPIYLLYGSERYLVNLYRNKLKDAILSGDDGMNLNFFEGKAIDFHEVIDIAQTLPFFRDHRLILFDNTGIFKAASDFADFLPDMPESTILVFCESEVDKRSRMYKAVTKLGYALELNGLDEKNLKLFIIKQLQEANKKMTENDVVYLINTVGSDMQNLVNETEKLISYTLQREIVTKEDIDAVCIQQLSGKIYQLTEAIIKKNKKEALSLYNTMLQLREKPLSILFQMIHHFNYLYLTSELLSKGYSNASLASALSLKQPFLAGKYASQCRKFSKKVLLDAIQTGTELESKVKTGLINEKIAVEILLVKMITM